MRTHALAALALAALAAPAAARAESTAGCHCFRDRTFDPLRPSAADPYVLATARSSLLSAAFGPAKSVLVRKVMSGTAAENLWVAHWAAVRSGADAEALLAAREAKGRWRAALEGVSGLGRDLDAALARDPSDVELAGLAVDEVLVKRLGADRAAVAALRGAGASSEEAIVATLISIRISAPALPLLLQVKSGKATWGGVLRDCGLAPGDLDGFVRTSVR
jgi:hypothetical protein